MFCYYLRKANQSRVNSAIVDKLGEMSLKSHIKNIMSFIILHVKTTFLYILIVLWLDAIHFLLDTYFDTFNQDLFSKTQTVKYSTRLAECFSSISYQIRLLEVIWTRFLKQVPLLFFKNSSKYDYSYKILNINTNANIN